MTRTQIGNTAEVVAVQGTASQSEVQTITGGATGGTFTLTFGNQVTAAIAFNASAATIQTALRNLSNISATGVVCAGGALPAAVTATFAAEYAGVNVPPLVMTSIDLSGGTVTIAQTTAPVVGSFFDADMDTLALMRARLTTISGAYYTAAQLDKLTYNDMVYALRMHDAPQTVK